MIETKTIPVCNKCDWTPVMNEGESCVKICCEGKLINKVWVSLESLKKELNKRIKDCDDLLSMIKDKKIERDTVMRLGELLSLRNEFFPPVKVRVVGV